MSLNDLDNRLKTALIKLFLLLDQQKVPYTIDGTLALLLQGVSLSINEEKQANRINVQWDAFADFVRQFEKPIPIEEAGGQASRVIIDEQVFEISCTYGTVIRTDPDRLYLSIGEHAVPVKCFDYFLRTLDQNDPLKAAVKEHLRHLQQVDASENGKAWNEDAYQAWVNRFGSPSESAEKIARNPLARLGALGPYFAHKELKGKKVINLLGSHGGKAIALAKMGADVTVVDISAENAEYARQTAAALHVPLNYLVTDVLTLSSDYSLTADYLFMELGIVHYFIDLEPLASLVYRLLKPGAVFILQDFHPVSTKLVTTKGKKQVVFGNYFDKKLIERQVAYGKHLRGEELVHKVYLKEWTLGEIVTAFASTGLRVKTLDEAPNMKIADIGLPKLFTLVCSKDQ
ncbi:MAG: class I SAM-dependent methyltransferase [Sporolactobacillus sp.]